MSNQILYLSLEGLWKESIKALDIDKLANTTGKRYWRTNSTPTGGCFYYVHLACYITRNIKNAKKMHSLAKLDDFTAYLGCRVGWKSWLCNLHIFFCKKSAPTKITIK